MNLWLTIAFIAIVGIPIACVSQNGFEVTTNEDMTIVSMNEDITIVSMEEPTLAECEESFGAGAVMDVPHAHPSTATAEQIEQVIGRFLVPSSLPEGLELTARRIGERVAYAEYASTPQEGKQTRFLTIEQGPTDGITWQLHAKDGHVDSETVGDTPAFVIRGGFVIRARISEGVEVIDSCGWDPDEENSLVFVRNGHGVRIAGSPAKPDGEPTGNDSELQPRGPAATAELMW